jgi:hypothetical protein
LLCKPSATCTSIPSSIKATIVPPAPIIAAPPIIVAQHATHQHASDKCTTRVHTAAIIATTAYNDGLRRLLDHDCWLLLLNHNLWLLLLLVDWRALLVLLLLVLLLLVLLLLLHRLPLSHRLRNRLGHGRCGHLHLKGGPTCQALRDLHLHETGWRLHLQLHASLVPLRDLHLHDLHLLLSHRLRESTRAWVNASCDESDAAADGRASDDDRERGLAGRVPAP